MLIEQKTINATQHNHSNFNTVPLIIGPIIRGFDRLFLKACDDAIFDRLSQDVDDAIFDRLFLKDGDDAIFDRLCLKDCDDAIFDRLFLKEMLMMRSLIAYV